MSWKEKLQSWDAIQIQRWYGLNSSTDAELHIFTDASTLAYGAVAYFRYIEGNDTRCSFIMSKSRLAPVKQKTLTVPKLELQAAVVACRMKNVILDEVKLEIKSVYFWCDSKTVINYLKNETTNFGVYIAHRVNEIRRSSSIEDWYYVPTKLNVTDDLTRFTGFQTQEIGETFTKFCLKAYFQTWLRFWLCFCANKNNQYICTYTRHHLLGQKI